MELHDSARSMILLPYFWADPKHPRKNNFPSLALLRPRPDGVVPARLGVMRADVERRHLGVGDRPSLRVLPVDEVSSDPQSGLGSCGCDVVDDRLVAVERSPRPILADLAEEPVLDGVPLRSPGGIVADGDLEAMWVTQALLDRVLEGPVAGTVAAAIVGENDHYLRLRRAVPALRDPPPTKVVRREIRRVVGGTDEDRAQVLPHVIDPVGSCHPHGVGAEVGTPKEDRCLVPGSPRILEVADHLLLLRVDAHHR